MKFTINPPYALLALLCSTSGCAGLSISQISGVVSHLHAYLHLHSLVAVVPEDDRPNDMLDGLWCFHLAKSFISSNLRMSIVTPTVLLDGQSTLDSNKRTLLTLYYEEDPTRFVLRELSKVIRLSEYVWLLFLNANTSLDSVFFGINIPFDCEFLVAQLNGGRIVLTEVYQISPTLPLQSYHFGDWKDKHGLLATTLPFYERRNSLSGLTLRVGVNHQTFTTILESKNNKVTKIGGYFGEVWMMLEKYLKMKTDFYIPPDGAYGALKDDGTWSGMIGMVLKDEVHISCNDFWWTKIRSTVVDEIAPILDVKTAIYIRASQSPKLSWDSFLTPLSPGVWTCLVIIMLPLSLTLLSSEMLRCMEKRKQQGLFLLTIKKLLQVFGIFCFQGGGDNDSAKCAQVVLLTTHITAMLIMISYSASLISDIVNNEYQPPFKGFDGFLEDGSYRMGMLANSAYLGYLQSSTDPIIQKIYKKYVDPYKSSYPKTFLKCADKTCNTERYAWYVADVVPKTVNIDSECQLLEVPETYVRGFACMIIKKNSPYRKILQIKSRDMHRGGILDLLYKKYVGKFHKVESNFSSVTLIQVAPILAAFLCGVIISILLLAIEITCVAHCKHLVTVGHKISVHIYRLNLE